jgi:hypothetical protein
MDANGGRETKKMRLSKKFLAGTISAVMLLGAPSAMAASSAQTGYSKPGGIIQTEIDNGGGNHNPGAVVESSSPGGVTETQSSGTTLPFTGLDVVLVAAAGGLLLALGLGMRRLARSSSVA